MKHKELNIWSLFEEKIKKYKVDFKFDRSQSINENILKIEKTLGAKAKSKAIKALKKAYDKKYGNWDKVNDLRNLCSDKWYLPIEEYLNDLPKDAVIIDVGCNDAREIEDLFKYKIDSYNFTLLDFSSKATSTISERFKNNTNIKIINNEFLNAEIKSNTYDCCLMFRTIQSSSLGLYNSILKCSKITKENGLIIISISNGYIDKQTNTPKKGMFDYVTHLTQE